MENKNNNNNHTPTPPILCAVENNYTGFVS